ncbi:SRPBCC family protein [Flindersiella endophytica]
MTSADGIHRRLTGRFTVALPPERAFGLFTPLGEQVWVRGWKPRFPAGTDTTFDDTEPGAVFETDAHGQTATWIVVERERGRRIRYARVIPHLNAGTITVTLAPAAEGEQRSEVTVTYELTALTDEGQQRLDEFAGHYPAFLQSWEEQIADHSG